MWPINRFRVIITEPEVLPDSVCFFIVVHIVNHFFAFVLFLISFKPNSQIASLNDEAQVLSTKQLKSALINQANSALADPSIWICSITICYLYSTPHF